MPCDGIEACRTALLKASKNLLEGNFIEGMAFIGGCIVALLLAFNVWGAGLAFLIYTIIYLQIESNIISPKIQGKGMNLPPLVILISITTKPS